MDICYYGDILGSLYMIVCVGLYGLIYCCLYIPIFGSLCGGVGIGRGRRGVGGRGVGERGRGGRGEGRRGEGGNGGRGRGRPGGCLGYVFIFIFMFYGLFCLIVCVCI